MGRAARNIKTMLMDAYKVARHLLLSCESLRHFESYMFGSSLFGVGSDFDILIVGPSGESLSRLKAELGVVADELPLDVLFMLPEEAVATKFVARQGCIALARLAAYSTHTVVAN